MGKMPKRAAILLIMLLLVLTSMLQFPSPVAWSHPDMDILNVDASNGESPTLLDSSYGFLEESYGQAIIISRKIALSDIPLLKQEIGVYEAGKTYNIIIDGHGTGWRPPTEEEWAQIADNGYIVEKITSKETERALSFVDHTSEPWFPPIGNQGSEGSCASWAVGYYMKTFQEAKEHNWDLSGASWDGGQPSVDYQERIISPDFIYHLINGGVDNGSSSMTAINLMCSIGASTWEKMPYNPSDSTTWPSEEAWREAPLYRGDSSGWQSMYVNTDDGLASLKNWIASGNLAKISVDASKYSQLTGNDVWTLDNYVSPSTNHANTIVGYDDSFSYMEQGQTRYGAFKIANSWGIGGLLGWENVPDGCFWISYEAMKQRVGRCEFFYDRIGYEPELVASFRLTHLKRGECTITLGVGSQTKSFTQYISGGEQPFCSNNILFDITEFKDATPDVYGQQFFLSVYDGGSSTTGAIYKFAIEYAESTDPMIATVDHGTVYAYVTLQYLDTNWRIAKQVNSDNDFIDSKVTMATDNNGYLYVAYDDWYPAVGHYAVFLRRSVDGGFTWSTVTTAYDLTHNLRYPSMAIDPYNNDIFIAVEREWTTSDHDILVRQFVDGFWSWSSVANVLGSDDRFPSITSEYQYGSGNWQYISYEYVHTYNDRDLMFAKSTDHGATWPVKKLYGDFPDYNVHAQTSITNAEGYLYIAYKWGADYESPCEIRVDRSTDFGTTWTQFTDIDGSANGCSFPSIAATHGGSTVMVAFQYDWSASDIDIRFSYSTDKGTNWVKGYSLFTSGLEDEKQPVLAVDGGGSTASNVGGYFHIACKVGSYIKYSKAHCSTPYSWTSPVIISEKWMGKSSAIATQFRNLTAEFHPYISWGDERTNNVYCSTVGHVHNLNTGLSYESIQEAINANETLNGHTLLAESRIYSERVTLNKSVALVGESRIDTIIRGSDYHTCIEVRADNSAIRCFTITGGYDGIYLLFCTNVTIEDNLVCGNEIGIALDYQSSGCKLIRNNVTMNNRWGIWIWGSSNHLLRNNTLTANSRNFGIYGWNLSQFTHDIDSSNEVNYGPIYYWVNQTDKEVPHDAGYVALVNCSRVVVEGLNISGNEQAVLLAYTANSTIRGNKMAGTGVGLYMYQSLHNTVVGNNVTGNSFGIYSGESNYNNITQNVVEANSYGIYLYNSSNYIWHNSFLANDIQVSSDNSSVSTWDDGYPSGGNFWSDYNGADVFNGLNQDQMGSDGKGDTPYIIDDSNQDRFPLTYRPTVARVCFAPGDLVLDQGIQVGYEFKIALIVENINDMAGFDIQFHWNTTYLAYINHTATIPVEAYPVPTAPSYYAGILHDPFFIAKDEVNATAGDYWIAAAHLSDQGSSGSGTVVVMAFRVIAKPVEGEEDVTLPFHITNHDFADSAAMQIPDEATNGSITIPAIRSIVVTNVNPAKTIVGEGFPLYVNATVENMGAYPENLTVTLYANATAVQTTNITIPGGNTTTATFVWNTTDWPLSKYILSVYVEPVPGEADTSDNTFLAGEVCVTIPGDVNCDHHVNIFDIVRIARDYGKPPPPLLDPNCDIDSDGDVDIFDIVIAAGNYGKGW